MSPALFDIFIGVAFACILVVGVAARPVLKPLWGRIIALSMVCAAAGFFLLGQASRASSSATEEQMTLYAGVLFLAAVVLVAVGLFAAARRQGSAA